MIYLASIYSLDADTDSELDVKRREGRYQYAMKRNYELMMQGNYIFSPIVSCHPLANTYDMPKDYEFYQAQDRHMIDVAEFVLVLDMKTFNGKNWKHSTGVKDEVEYAKSTGKTVLFLDCDDFLDVVPAGDE